MTLQEMQAYVDDTLDDYGLPKLEFDSLRRRANRVAKTLARDYGFPVRYEKDKDATIPFPPPVDSDETGLISAEWQGEKYECNIPIMTVEEANRKYPHWEENTYEGSTVQFPVRLIIYDPKNITAPIYPVGFEAGDKIRFTIRVRFDDMLNAGDSPWGNKYKDWHEIIPLQVAVDRLIAQGDEIMLAKSQRPNRKLEDMKERFFNYIRQGVLVMSAQ